MSSPGNLWIVSAPSGGGKTSLTRALLPELARHGVPAVVSVSTTTRAARPGEENGVHYHFVDEPRFVQMIAEGEFLEHAQVFGRRYGTSRADTERLLACGTDVILDIDWQGARQVREQRPDTHSVFILPPSRSELERRLRARGQDSDEVIAARMRAAREEMSHYGEYAHLVVNEEFGQALSELTAVFLALRLACASQQKRHSKLIAALLR